MSETDAVAFLRAVADDVEAGTFIEWSVDVEKEIDSDGGDLWMHHEHTGVMSLTVRWSVPA